MGIPGERDRYDQRDRATSIAQRADRAQEGDGVTSRLALALNKLDARGLELVCDRYKAVAAIASVARRAGRHESTWFVMLSANDRAQQSSTVH